MAWQIAIIVDPEFEVNRGYARALYAALDRRYTVQHCLCSSYKKSGKRNVGPEAVNTTFKVQTSDDRQSELLNILNTADEHHSNLAKINIFGLTSSPELNAAMRKGELYSRS